MRGAATERHILHSRLQPGTASGLQLLASRWRQLPRCSVACRTSCLCPPCHSVDGKPLFVSDGSVASIASTSRNLDIGAGSAVSWDNAAVLGVGDVGHAALLGP